MRKEYIKCKKCNESINSELMMCPYCGKKTDKYKSNGSFFATLFVIIMIVIVIWLICNIRVID